MSCGFLVCDNTNWVNVGLRWWMTKPITYLQSLLLYEKLICWLKNNFFYSQISKKTFFTFSWEKKSLNITFYCWHILMWKLFKLIFAKADVKIRSSINIRSVFTSPLDNVCEQYNELHTWQKEKQKKEDWKSKKLWQQYRTRPESSLVGSLLRQYKKPWKLSISVSCISIYMKKLSDAVQYIPSRMTRNVRSISLRTLRAISQLLASQLHLQSTQFFFFFCFTL